MAAPWIHPSFAKGELTPELWGHVDLAAFHSAAATMRNMFVSYRGGAYSRAGTRYIGRSKQRPDFGQPKPRIITWQFNNQQGYVLEFGDNYVRFIFEGGYVLEPGFPIGAISRANPGVLTTAIANNFATGDWVAIQGITGMPQLADATLQVGTILSPTQFQLLDLDGNLFNTTTFPPFAGGGIVSRIYTISSPYGSADLDYLKFDQSADVMTITLVNPNNFPGGSYPVFNLARLGPTNWTLTQDTRTTTTPAVTNITSAVATVGPNPSSSPPTLPAAYAYVITKVDGVTGQESNPSPVVNITDSVDMAVTAGSVVITWEQVGGSGFYNIYRAPTSYNTDPSSPTQALPVPIGAQFGFIGQTLGNQFVDSGITPDFSISPPMHVDPFAPGQILAISITGSSSDWTNATVSITTATGSNFVGDVIITNHQITGVLVIDNGQQYLPSDTPVFSGGGTSASGTLVVTPMIGTFPAVVSYFQQRRAFAQTFNQPDTEFFSKPGQFDNFDVSNPVIDSDAITATPWSEKVDGIQWMLTMPLGLLTFTGSGVWQVSAPGSFASSPAAITPTNITAFPQSSIGCSATVPPLRVNWDVLYVESYGSAVLDLSYQIFFNIYAGTDISWMAAQLFQGVAVEQWCYARNPYRVVPAVRNDGIMINLTYLKEQEIAGWSRYDTQGYFRSVCSVTEPPVDAVYVVVERPVSQGGTRFFIERFDDRLWSDVEFAWCVDAGIQTPFQTPDVGLSADASSGPVNFFTIAGTLPANYTGWVIRFSGGIAQITGQPSSTHMIGIWVLPCDTIPNDPLSAPISQPAGGWSVALPVTQVYGLLHLVGRPVVGLADGVPIGPLTVQSDGHVDLPFAASVVTLGMGFTAQLQSVYLDVGQPTIQGRRRSLYAVTLRLVASSLCQAGANEGDGETTNWANLPTASPQNVDPIPSTYIGPGGQSTVPLFNGDQRLLVPSGWNKRGQVAAQQTLPLPLAVTAMMPEFLPGDEPELQISPRQPNPRGR